MVVVVVVIVSLLQSYLTSPFYKRQINSLLDLYSSPIFIVTNDIQWKDKISGMLEDVTKYGSWNDKIIGIPMDRLETGIQTFNNTIAFVTFDDMAPVYLKVQSMLDIKAYHVLKDKFFARFLLSFDISSKFQFTEQINTIIHQLNSAGLIGKWFEDGMERYMWLMWIKNLNHPLRTGKQSDESEFFVGIGGHP